MSDAYSLAKGQFAAWGVDTEKAMRELATNEGAPKSSAPQKTERETPHGASLRTTFFCCINQ